MNERDSSGQGGCRRCGGELRQVAVLANYKSFVVVLMRCAECGEAVERKENAHRPADTTRSRVRRPARQQRPASAGRRDSERVISEPVAVPEAPQPPPRRRLQPATKIERPFNVRVTRRDS
jgi:hypothetical protein